jgi:hypothetical protein
VSNEKKQAREKCLANGVGQLYNEITETQLRIQSMNGFEFNYANVDSLKETTQYLEPPVLIIFDGLSKMIKGKLRENETADAIKVTRHWSELTKIGATLLILHHLTLKKREQLQRCRFLTKCYW